jgi:hypothetical protein
VVRARDGFFPLGRGGGKDERRKHEVKAKQE